MNTQYVIIWLFHRLYIDLCNLLDTKSSLRLEKWVFSTDSVCMKITAHKFHNSIPTVKQLAKVCVRCKTMALASNLKWGSIFPCTCKGGTKEAPRTHVLLWKHPIRACSGVPSSQKSSVKELKSHLLLFCLSAVLFVLQCLSAYVHDINTEDMELENNFTELWQYQHLNHTFFTLHFHNNQILGILLEKAFIHVLDLKSDQVRLRSLFMLHV